MAQKGRGIFMVYVDIDAKDAPIQHKELSERVIVMRDSKNPDGPVLYFTEAEWEAFIGGVKDGEFDDLLDEEPPADLR